MVTFNIVVTNKVGLHARPAAQFVAEANKHKNTTVKVRKTGGQTNWMNAKSILSVLTLGVEANQEIELMLEGPDEQETADALRGLIERNFGEG
jgi:phosphotransferase system HPr (HPr) family protein